jgi:hypothetical protein
VKNGAFNSITRRRTGTDNGKDGIRFRNDPLLGGIADDTTTSLCDSLPEYLCKTLKSVGNRCVYIGDSGIREAQKLRITDCLRDSNDEGSLTLRVIIPRTRFYVSMVVSPICQQFFMNMNLPCASDSLTQGWLAYPRRIQSHRR